MLSLSQAATLMKVVANSSRSTVQLIQVELAKAYLFRTLSCKDSGSHSIYCLANVYLAVLYYTTGQFQTAIYHCTLVMRSQYHSQCSSHVVQGERLPSIGQQVDNILGLAVLYKYIRVVVFNEEQEMHRVSVFTTELFAHYMHIRFQLMTNCYHQLLQTSLAGACHQYLKFLCNSHALFVTDVMLFRLAHNTKYLSNDPIPKADRGESMSQTNCKLDTSKLVELLQQSAVEHVRICHELELRYFGSFVTPDLEALCAYKYGQYERCLQLSIRDVRSLIINKYNCLCISIVPELTQLMDGDLTSLIGLAALVNSSRVQVVIMHPLSLSLYLISQCQIKLRRSVTSLYRTLDHFQLARFHAQMLRFLSDDLDLARESVLGHWIRCAVFDQVILKFVEQKILRYMSEIHTA